MPYIETNQKFPMVKVPRTIYHQMKAVIMATSNVTIFVNFKKSGNDYVATEVYIPKQATDATHNIVDTAELNKIGKGFNGICRGGLAQNRIEITKDDVKIFNKMFCGEENYVRMQINKDGDIYADIIEGMFSFCDVQCIMIDAVPNEVADATKKIVNEKVRKWVYQDGYEQPERVYYPIPEIIEKGLGWRDVVGKDLTAENKDGFFRVCTPNKDDLYSWLEKELVEYYGEENVIAQNGYLFAVGNICTCLSAHIDTVFKKTPHKFVQNGKKLSSPQGIGGDDRCGIFGVLYIMATLEKEGSKPYIFLSTDEEKGGQTTRVGSLAVKEMAKPINYILALDRAGKTDSVYYECDNKEFKEWIDSFGFVEAIGSQTDICTLCDDWDVAGVNFSVGYYDNHHETEYVILSELYDTLRKCINIIHATDPKKHFAFCKKKNKWAQNVGTGSHVNFNSCYCYGDKIFVKKNGATCYNDQKFQMYEAGVVMRVPAYTNSLVTGVTNDYVRIRYKGKDVWIKQTDIVLDY